MAVLLACIVACVFSAGRRSPSYRRPSPIKGVIAQPLAEPLDWQQSVYPSRWKALGKEQTFDWVGPDGVG